MSIRRFFYSIILLSGLLSAQGADQFDIPHVAASSWKTTITIYNLGTTTETITLIHWNSAGVQTGSTQHDVPAHSNIEILSSGFGYDGIARVESPEDASIRVKLSYLFLKDNAQSLCEFFLPKNELAKKWFLPNPFQPHFDWFGIAMANHGDQTVSLTLKAYKNSHEVGSTVKQLGPKEKTVGISNTLWPGLNYGDIEFVIIESDHEISVPISITGNNEQDRHLFFSAGKVPTPGSVRMYLVPHIPGGNWNTTLRAYNPMGEEGTSQLVAINSQGSEISDFSLGTNALRVDELTTADNELPKDGVVWIKTSQPMIYTLSYRYANSESICEFILQSEISKHWIVPNTINTWFDWFGLAFSNFNKTATQVTLNAYKNGQNIATETISVDPNRKKVALSDTLWTQSHIGYGDVDLVVVDSDLPIPSPIAITGNTDQNRHVFFQGQNMSSSINIPDAGFKAFLVSNYDSNGDGEISAGEALVPIAMDTPGEDGQPGAFQNLEGLQHFTNLIRIEASYEQIISIPDISNLKRLTYLSLRKNPITMIPDLINVTALRDLDVAFTAVETLHHLPGSLQKLYANSGKLRNVDLTDLADLTYCTFYYNPLETAKTSNLTSLTVFNAEYCSITDLDFSTCPNLEKLYLQEGKLTSLNISNGHSLNHLDADGNKLSSITGFNQCQTTMKTLYLSRNAFTSLDVSGFSKLTDIGCNGNNIQSLNIAGATALTRLLANVNKLTTLNLTGLDNLEEVDLQSNQLTQLDLTNKPYLTEVSVQHNQLTSLSFTGSNALENVYCSNNLIENIPDVTAASGMKTYWCTNNYFGSDDCPVIQAIEAMNLEVFSYNTQADGSTVNCP